MKKLIIFLIVVPLMSCVLDENREMHNQTLSKRPVPVFNDTRIKVKRISVFTDDIAYNAERGIYIITDSKTGKEYIGISGVGIAETGSHSRIIGKAATQEADER